MLRLSHSSSRDAPVRETFARRTAIGKMLHSLLDAVSEGLAGHREYERLMSMGVGHDSALKVALSETSHSTDASARGTSIQSAFLILVAAIGGWIDRRRDQKMLARLDERLLRDIGLTRSEHSAEVKPLSVADTA
jgi:uncharacterized protein YjiS (DUF1127 family)